MSWESVTTQKKKEKGNNKDRTHFISSLVTGLIGLVLEKLFHVF